MKREFVENPNADVHNACHNFQATITGLIERAKLLESEKILATAKRNQAAAALKQKQEAAAKITAQLAEQAAKVQEAKARQTERDLAQLAAHTKHQEQQLAKLQAEISAEVDVAPVGREREDEFDAEDVLLQEGEKTAIAARKVRFFVLFVKRH